MSNKEEAIKCYLDGLTAATKAFTKHQSLFILYLNLEQAKLQAMAIIFQPKAPVGKMVVYPNEKGAVIDTGSELIVHIPKLKAGRIILRDDTGKPGGDLS